jgi:murein DD-endopeptidase MepM/ murein hydrolase activator NlpD
MVVSRRLNKIGRISKICYNAPLHLPCQTVTIDTKLLPDRKSRMARVGVGAGVGRIWYDWVQLDATPPAITLKHPILTDCMTTPEQIQHSTRPLFQAPRKNRLLTGTAIFLGVCAFGAFGVVPLAPDAADLPVKTLSQELALPNLSQQLEQLEKQEQHYIREERIRSGDSLASLLNRLGVDDPLATTFIKSDKIAHTLLQLKSGKRVQAEIDEDGELRSLRATLGEAKDNSVTSLLIERSGEQFVAREVAEKLERRIEMHTASIKSSLFAATDAAQIPDSVAKQIVEMFSTNIDFASDLRRGDHFNVVYETFWQDGELVRAGRVLAGEFTNANHVFQSVWFEEPGSEQGGGYYSFDGKSLKKAFLKSPLEFTRISSGFAMRLHPISGQWKQHKGVDFAAGTGTPIKASGDGTIDFVGGQNGYGNLVVIKHWSNYSTAYGHMSRFAPGLRKGSKVHQGDIIGYVGSTGWATGPHLHYEFRVSNEPRDPLAINIPNQQPLTGGELARFKLVADDIRHRFALLHPERGGQQLARLSSQK